MLLDFARDVMEAYTKDKDSIAIIPCLRRGDDRLSVKNEIRNDLLHIKKDGAIQILRMPQVDKILLRPMPDFHEAAVVAHPGVERTLSTMRQYFWWPGMREHFRQ
ncbi:hypothetical protein PsorP6_016589 [Peronosclerospora sorghi]|uniref:Uncharacterized protein n=1 Tax=Peronosclerospora sorghi TaxID=230839 RepID=A0ACC0VJG2_9STRA|nr:hypothetical protein PsorP6_016589 [Peronosclerospora sorghi]